MSSSQQLNRSLGLKFVIAIVIGNILGSGVYKKVAPMGVELQSEGWILICWLLAGIITLFGALSNAEVAGLLANTGGEFAYYKTIYNRFFAFMYGWSLFTVIQTAAISSLAYVFAQSVNSIWALPEVLPSMAEYSIGGIFYPFADLNVKLVAVALIILLSWVNSKGIVAGAGMGSVILMLVFVGIMIIVAFGLTSPAADLSKPFNMEPSNGVPVTISSVFTAMLAAFWAYQGWAAVGFVGGEVKNANKNIPKGILLGVGAVVLLYLIVNATYLAVLPMDKLTSISGTQIAAVEAVREFWGNNGALFISILILVTTFSCTHVTILSSCRPYYAMAQSGMFFKGVDKLNKAKAPANSLFAQGIWACVLVFSGTFDQLTDMIIFAVFIFYGATTLGVFILRKRMPDAHRPYKVWGYPVIPSIFILFCIVLLINTFYTRPREAFMGIGLILTGVPLFFYFKKRKKREDRF